MKRSRMLTALVALVPALAGLVTLSAAADRVDGIELVPAAVVNSDVIVTMDDGSQLPAGRLLTAELTQPEDGDLQFAWEIVPPDVAAEGLASGDYYAVVTIPEDFSQSVVDLLGGEPAPAQITLEASDPASPLMARVSTEVTEAATDILGRFFTMQYLNGTLNGTSQLADAMTQAADGAGQLADGAEGASDGAGQLADGTSQLADGLGLLSDGTIQAAGGADQLADGAGQLAEGAALAADGADQLADGTSGLADGVTQVDAGADALADGATQLSDGLVTYSGGMTSLAEGSAELVTGSAALADGADLLADGTRQLADRLTGLSTGDLGIDMDELMTGVDDALTLAQQTVDALAALQTEWDGWTATLPSYDEVVEQIRTAYSGAVAEQCATATDPQAIAICEQLAAVEIPGSAELQAQLDAALAELEAQLAQIPTGNPDYPTLADVLAATQDASGDISANLPTLEEVDAFLANVRTLVDEAPAMLEGVEALADGADDLADGASALADGISQFDGGVQALADGAGELSGGAGALADGAGQLADGTGQLAGGAIQLADGMATYADGAGALADGAAGVAGGADQLADGIWQLADGAGQSAAGASALADGTSELSDGLVQLSGGAGELSDGLAEGAAQIPVYTEEQAAAMAATLVRPIGVDEIGTLADGPATSRSGFAPTAAVIVLWLGALASYLLVEAVPSRRRFAAGGPARLAFAGLLPGLALGAAQAAALAFVLLLAGVKMASPLTVLLVALAAAGAFAAVHQGLVAAFGRRAGLTVSLLFAVVQVAVLTTLMPAVTAPGILQPLVGILPMGIAADGLTAGVLGGAGSLGATLVGLGVWAALGFGLGVLGAGKRQGVTVEELRAGYAAAH